MPRLDCVLSFVDDDDEHHAAAAAGCSHGTKAEAIEKKELWGLGSVGGFQCYVSSEGDDDGGDDDEVENAKGDIDGRVDEQDDAAVYRRDVSDSDGVLNVPAISNALSVVLCEPGVLDFVKYVSGDAPSSRWDVRYEMSVLSEVVAAGGGAGEDEDELDE